MINAPRAAVAAFMLALPSSTYAVPMVVPPVLLPPPTLTPSLPAPDSPALVLGRALSRLFTIDDYPVAALEARQQGRVTVELRVTTEGRVESCQIIDSAGSAALDRTTCSVLTRRARFRPARDCTGQSVPDRIRQTIHWEMDSLPYESIGSISIVRTNQVGVIVDCRDEAGLPWCNEPDFDLDRMARALTGTLPPSAWLVRTMVFTPAEAKPPTLTSETPSGQRSLYSGSAKINIDRNGNVTGCNQTSRPGDRPGVLCGLVESWLFRIEPTGGSGRNGVWRISLATLP